MKIPGLQWNQVSPSSKTSPIPAEFDIPAIQRFYNKNQNEQFCLKIQSLIQIFLLVGVRVGEIACFESPTLTITLVSRITWTDNCSFAA